jgi:hypothetical protein
MSSPSFRIESGRVAATLHEQVENLALAVHCSPELERLAADHHGHLVEMPLRSRAGSTAAKLSGKQWAKLQHPASDRLVGDIQPALGEQILDITESEGEANIEPNGVPNDRRSKLVTSERDGCHSPS